MHTCARAGLQQQAMNDVTVKSYRVGVDATYADASENSPKCKYTELQSRTN